MVNPKIISSTILNGLPLGNNTDENYTWSTSPITGVTYQIEILSGNIINTIPVGSDPRGLYSDGNNVWVCNYNDSTLSIINYSNPSEVIHINVG